MTDHLQRALALHSMHVQGDPLILPNAWDVASARAVLAAGAQAVATTSAGVAWSLGHRDGNELSRETALDAVRRITTAVPVPVTADIEGGYGDTSAEVARTVAASIEAGVSGVNLEDTLRPVGEQEHRIAAARRAADEAGIPLFINARIDTHRLGDVGGDHWFDETVTRAAAYARAGASGIFVLGALRADTIERLADATTLPVNVAFGPGTLSISELAKAGASRISAGSSIAEAAYSLAHQWASSMLDSPDAAPAQPPALGWAAMNGLIRD
ncbi:3-methyl-2-oxobutanoate hydroxymethyltransferase [Plantibacter sp. Leaf171]|uniref:isocitrate lyase/PEP mutase family protein n=1 Tax=unclassified Plantibacter TaxID=2624265 RepID=UPI0006F75200|nr:MULTISPECIES: isocitrate lyase/phosphoenolpyruvate mutase family protein [unclassified Plantibacter]KQM16456.1 3-methyl-2-oxobutanoate hydroxymethyltransferase [Plantibacter sp. Leaf1]KQR59590.1 3-methyl-2-oxobutanoate hydroxymethyltransferase [Plantibacter sp. Leaf171]